MSRFGLVGPSYASQSPNLDAEVCINLYCEQDDGGAGNAPIAMYPTPGTKVFAANLGLPTLNAHVNFDTSAKAGAGLFAFFKTTGTAPVVLQQQLGGSFVVAMSPITAGSTLIVGFLSTGATSGPITISDNRSNVYLPLGSIPVGVGATLALWYCPTPVTGLSLLITMTTGAFSGVLSTYAAEISNLLVPTPLDVETMTSTASGSSLDMTLTATRAEDFAIFFYASNGQGTHFAPTGSGWVQLGTNASYQFGTGIFHQFLSTGGKGPIRGELKINGRGFVVSESLFFEVFANGSATAWGTVVNDALPVTMAATPQQLLLASGGTAYVFDLMANTLTAIPGATFDGPVAQAAVCDDFFLLTIQDSKEFYVSAPLDATDWVTNGSAIVSVFPDNIVSMLVFQRQVWFFSDTQSVVYYDSGNIFPFDVNPNAFIEAGCAAENSPVIFNNSIAWLGADARGEGKVWLANGYTPTRISNHAIEFAMQSYKRIDNAVGLSYQDQGHEFYVLYFPTPSVTWVYDAMTGMWHQRGFFVESISQFRAAHYQNHMFIFGKHLVGDWQSGNVYEMNIPVSNGSGGWDFVTDAGNPIRRVRRAPHVSREQKRQFHIELQIFLESGLGPSPPLLDGAGKARGPQMMLRWSDDSAHTWSNELVRDCGQAGEYRKRARWLQLGVTRDRIYEISMSDPIPWRIIDGYLQVAEGTGI